MSTTRDALLAAIRENLDDDLPRLVFADWLDEHGEADRAAFIRRQCELARTPDTEPAYFDLKAELLHHPADPKWLAELPAKVRKLRHTYRRGFVDAVHLTAKKFLADGDALMHAAAVRRVTLSGVRNHIPDLVRYLPLGHVWDLSLSGNKTDDAGLNALFNCPLLHHVRGLDLGGTGLSVAAAGRLGRSKDVPNLRRLRMSWCNLRDAGVEAVVTSPRFADLVELDVARCGSGPRSLRAVGALQKLRVLNFVSNRLTDKTADVLLDADLFPALEELYLYAGYYEAGPDLPAWGDLVHTPLFRRLTRLEVCSQEVPADAWHDLPADFGPPGLRLRFHSPHHETNLRLAESPLVARCSRLNVTAPDSGEDVLRAVAENPAAASLRGLSVHTTWGTRPPGLGRVLAAVADSPHLANVIDFGYSRPLSDDDVVTLSRAAFAGELRQLTTSPDELTAKGLAMLADPGVFPKLRNLGVSTHGLDLRQPTAAAALRERFGAGFGWGW